jgi:hypothetical protein
MVTTEVELQDGFKGDEVRVEVDGHPVFHSPCVTSHPTLGRVPPRRDGRFRFDRGEGPSVLSVSVPGRGISGTVPLPPLGPPYLGLAIRGGRLVATPSDRPFVHL